MIRGGPLFTGTYFFASRDIAFLGCTYNVALARFTGRLRVLADMRCFGQYANLAILAFLVGIALLVSK